MEKDLVVVIDTSGSMSSLHETRTLIQIAKQAAISVIQTLSPNDRVRSCSEIFKKQLENSFKDGAVV